MITAMMCNLFAFGVACILEGCPKFEVEQLSCLISIMMACGSHHACLLGNCAVFSSVVMSGDLYGLGFL